MSDTELRPWIENVAAVDVSQGFHHDCGSNSMLIQIRDPHTTWWPTPRYNFQEVHQFEFLDAEWDDGFPEEDKIQADQAKAIVALLQHALDNHMNVVVHCMAGICRSGAVAEVGVMLGFRDAGRMRIPNLRVKKMLMQELCWLYEEKPIE